MPLPLEVFHNGASRVKLPEKLCELETDVQQYAAMIIIDNNMADEDDTGVNYSQDGMTDNIFTQVKTAGDDNNCHAAITQMVMMMRA